MYEDIAAGKYRATIKSSILHSRCEGHLYVHEGSSPKTFLNPTGRSGTFFSDAKRMGNLYEVCKLCLVEDLNWFIIHERVEVS